MVVGFGPTAGFVSGELLYRRQLADGTWTTGFETLSGGLGSAVGFSPGRPWRFGRVSLARVNEELHVCGVTSNSGGFTNIHETGLLVHAARRYDAMLDAGGFERQQWTSNWEDVAGLA